MCLISTASPTSTQDDDALSRVYRWYSRLVQRSVRTVPAPHHVLFPQSAISGPTRLWSKRLCQAYAPLSRSLCFLRCLLFPLQLSPGGSLPTTTASATKELMEPYRPDPLQRITAALSAHWAAWAPGLAGWLALEALENGVLPVWPEWSEGCGGVCVCFVWRRGRQAEKIRAEGVWA